MTRNRFSFFLRQIQIKYYLHVFSTKYLFCIYVSIIIIIIITAIPQFFICDDPLNLAQVIDLMIRQYFVAIRRRSEHMKLMSSLRMIYILLKSRNFCIFIVRIGESICMKCGILLVAITF